MNPKAVKQFLVDYTLPLSAIGTIAGGILTFIGVAGVFFEDKSWVKDSPFFKQLGYFDLWALIIGVLFLLIAVFYLYDNLRARKKFKELTATDSKSKILRNFEEIDELAYKLGTPFVIVWKDIKRKHKIRK